MSRQKEYFVFRRPNSMRGHKFTDDVALCKAFSLQQAKKQFSKYYADVQDCEICKITGENLKRTDEVIILTDY